MQTAEVWRVAIPGLGGHTQSGYRPALVLATGLPSVVVIDPFTSNARARRFPHTIEIEPTADNGLTEISILLLFQILAANRQFLESRLGVLEPDVFGKAKTGLRRMLDL